MPANQVETVGLDLVGDYRSKAEEDARASLALAASLEKLGASAAAVKGPPPAMHDALKATKSEFDAAKDAAARFRAEADRAFALGNRRRGEALEKAAEKLDPIVDQQKEAGSFFGDKLKSGADYLKGAAASAAMAIGAAVVAGGAALLAAGVKYGVEQTAAAEKQIAILDRLTGGHGAEAKDFSEQLAAETGVGDDAALERVKALAQHFTKAQTADLFKASADIGAVKGEDKAASFLQLMETIAAKGKTNERSLNSLAESGVKAEGVLEQLRQKGESLDVVRARVKAGQVSMTDFTKAVSTAVAEDIGGVAGKGLDAEINRLKIEFGNIFEEFDLSPIKDALKAVADTLASPAGSALKDGLKEVVQASIDLLKPLSTEGGKKALYDFFATSAQAAREVASVIREIRAEIQTLTNWHDEGGIFTLKNLGKLVGIGGGGAATADEKLVEQQVAAAQAKRAEEDARRAGTDIAKGYAAGIREGAPEIADAVKSSLQSGIEAGNKTLDRHSPSKVFEGMGKDSALGYVKGANDNADLVKGAGAGIGRGAIAGAGGEEAGAAGGTVIQLHVDMGGIHVQAAAGSSPEAVTEQADAIMAALTPRVSALVRMIQRDLSEMGGSLATRVA